MRRFAFLMATALFFALPSGVMAAGQLIKGPTAAVYYVDEGKRYVFPNEKVYFSWYADFSSVSTVSSEELASYPLGGNVTYRPGTRLVKIQSDPRVYAVAAGGTLRWISNETAARDLFGETWSRKVDDVADAFFIDYRTGTPVATAADIETSSVGSISEDVAFRRGTPLPSGFAAIKFGAWSDPSVWGGRVPTAGSDVVISRNVKVIYDLAHGPSVRTLDVQGELELLSSASTFLAARTIRVSGTLSAGSETAPLPAASRAEIFLTGSEPTSDDGLRVDGGRLELHGQPAGLFRARLAVPAAVGATAIKLETPPGWKVGDEILILSTSARAEENETRVIAAIDGIDVKLDAPLAFAHRAETHLRAEVVPLSRNVVIRGVGQGMGSGVSALNRAALKIENASFLQLGRMGVRGMHPISVDGLGLASASYVRDSVIRTAGNRCLSIRQTRGLRVERNAAFEGYGPCIALSEGAETENLLANNVVASVRSGLAGSGDETAAAFLIRNPSNRLEGNLAVGSDGHGYWYDLPEKAVTNEAISLYPRESLLGAFAGNEVRAAAQDGLRVDDARGRAAYVPAQKASFFGLRALMNGGRGFWIRGAGVEVNDAFLAENAIGGSFSAFGAAFKDSVVFGTLGKTASGSARRGFVFLDGPVTVSGVRFENFTGTGSAFGFEERMERAPDPRNAYRSVTFEHAADWRANDPTTAGELAASVRDVDGAKAITMNGTFLNRDCALDAAANVRRCTNAHAQLLVALRDPIAERTLTFSDVGSGATYVLAPGPAYDAEYAYLTVAEGGDYRVSALPAMRANVTYAGQSSALTLRIPANPAVRVTAFDGEVARSESLSPAPGEWAYDGARNEVILHLPPGAEWNVSW